MTSCERGSLRLLIEALGTHAVVEGVDAERGRLGGCDHLMTEGTLEAGRANVLEDRLFALVTRTTELCEAGRIGQSRCDLGRDVCITREALAKGMAPESRSAILGDLVEVELLIAALLTREAGRSLASALDARDQKCLALRSSLGELFACDLCLLCGDVVVLAALGFRFVHDQVIRSALLIGTRWRRNLGRIVPPVRWRKLEHGNVARAWVSPTAVIDWISGGGRDWRLIVQDGSGGHCCCCCWRLGSRVVAECDHDSRVLESGEFVWTNGVSGWVRRANVP